jgi:DNA repair exonuclease SbcCD nuclease subunit
MTKLHKSLSFTDIHWGARNNSEQHNQDNLNYIDWFCKQAAIYQPDHIVFLGDWFENRSAVNISTLHYSYLGAKKLNNLNIPIYFIIGNHDCFHKHSREIYSTVHFHEFSNFHVINVPTIVESIEGSPLFCPYLFHHEYQLLQNYKKSKVWWGHFEFQGFIITGSSIRMKSGPNPDDFEGPTRIFSGHFHKRQEYKNIYYIGNVFPTNFNDANDTERGCVFYDYMTNTITPINWTDCPKFVKIKLSDLLENKTDLPTDARIHCLEDVSLNYEEQIKLKQTMIADFNLREFVLEEEGIDLGSIDIDPDINIDTDVEIENTDEFIIHMLNELDVPNINNTDLVRIYKTL